MYIYMYLDPPETVTSNIYGPDLVVVDPVIRHPNNAIWPYESKDFKGGYFLKVRTGWLPQWPFRVWGRNNLLLAHLLLELL